MSVLVTILTRDSRLQEDVQDAALLAVQAAVRAEIGVAFARQTERYGTAIGRNRAVARFLKTEHSHLLFIDDDVRVPQDTVRALLECDADVAGGCYVFLSKTGHGLVPSLAVKRAGRWGKRWFDGIVDADAVGGGCMLIRREVFETVGHAGNWFHWPTWLDDDGEFQCRSDDVDFCQRALVEGCTVKAHGSVRCGHFRLIDLSALLPAESIDIKYAEEDGANEQRRVVGL